MKTISRTELIRSNRDLKMELNLAYEKVRTGLNEKSIDMLNTHYDSIYDYSCVKSCSGNFSGHYVISEYGHKYYAYCHECHRNKPHIHCSKCHRTKYQLKLLSEEKIKTLKKNLMETFDHIKKTTSNSDQNDVLLAREILSRLYQMNVNNIPDPKTNYFHLEFQISRIYNRINQIDKSIFEIPTINIIKDNSEISKNGIVRKQKIKSIDEINLQENHTIKNFDHVFSKKQIQKLVITTYENTGIILDDSIEKIQLSEYDVEQSKKRDQRLKEKNLVAEQKLKLKQIQDQNRKDKIDKLISNDPLLQNSSILKNSVIEFFRMCNTIQRNSMRISNEKLSDLKYELSLVVAEQRHYTPQKTEFAKKRCLELELLHELINDAIQCIAIGFED